MLSFLHSHSEARRVLERQTTHTEDINTAQGISESCTKQDFPA
jgi:hypothetical protein